MLRASPVRAIQLSDVCQTHTRVGRGGDIPRAPALNYGGQERLLRIVCNICPEAVDNATVVTVWGPYDLGRGHCRSNAAEYAGQRLVKKLPAEVTEFFVIGILLVR